MTIERLDVALVVEEAVGGDLGHLGQEPEVAVVMNGRYRRARLLGEDGDSETGLWTRERGLRAWRWLREPRAWLCS